MDVDFPDQIGEVVLLDSLTLDYFKGVGLVVCLVNRVINLAEGAFSDFLYYSKLLSVVENWVQSWRQLIILMHY